MNTIKATNNYLAYTGEKQNSDKYSNNLKNRRKRKKNTEQATKYKENINMQT